MNGISTEKVSGGKLLRIKVSFDSKIEFISITGDFFAHPENVIENIEKSLVGINADSTENDIGLVVKKVLDDNNAELIGIDIESIARNTVKAIGEAE